MQYDLFADLEVDTTTPFTDRIVCVLGTFSIPTKQLISKICSMGGECKASTKVSRNVHYILIGQNVPGEQLDYLRTVNFHGYYPRILTESDFQAISQGHYAGYEVAQTIQKQLHLTYQHYLTLRPQLKAHSTILYTSELYVAPDTHTPQAELFQRLGDRGIYANAYIDDTTDYIVISDATLHRLEQGEGDEVLHYIEQRYNASHTQSYRYAILSESDVLQWLNA